MNYLYGDYNMRNGQPGYSSKKDSETAKEFYKLGRKTASLEKERKDNESLSAMNQIQSIMLTEKELELKKLVADLEIKMQQQAAMAPPPGGMSMPPDMFGVPPDIAMGPGMGPGMDPGMGPGMAAGPGPMPGDFGAPPPMV